MYASGYLIQQAQSRTKLLTLQSKIHKIVRVNQRVRIVDKYHSFYRSIITSLTWCNAVSVGVQRNKDWTQVQEWITGFISIFFLEISTVHFFYKSFKF